MCKSVKKADKFTIISVMLICLCLLSTFIPIVTARDPFAPSWLKEGTYATYIAHFSPGYMTVFDVNDPMFEGLDYLCNNGRLDIIEYSNASFTWRCISVNNTMAKLRITFDYEGEKLIQPTLGSSYTIVSLGGEFYRRTGEVYVDIFTRAVYNMDGVFLGTTHLWLPANPRVGQELTIWEAGDEVIKFPVVQDVASLDFDNWTPVPTIYIGHPQGEEIFWTWNNIEINGNKEELYMSYDLDTGVCIYTYLDWDPLMAAIGISRNTALHGERSTVSWIYANGFLCSDTNIDNFNFIDFDMPYKSGKTNWFDYSFYLFLSAILGIILPLIVTVVFWGVCIFKKHDTYIPRYMFRWYLWCMFSVVMIWYPVYLMIQSVEITKVVLEVTVALFGFYSMIAVYLLTANGNRLNNFKKRIRMITGSQDITKLLNESNENDQKSLLCNEIVNVTGNMKKTASFMNKGFFSFAVSLSSSILLLCFHTHIKEPFTRLISSLYAPYYYNQTHKVFMFAEIALISDFITTVFKILAGSIMMASLFFGIYCLWQIIRISRQEQKDTINKLETVANEVLGLNVTEPKPKETESITKRIAKWFKLS